jgi:CHAD domain-containing protein
LSAARDGAVALDVHAALLNRFGARLYASVGAEVRQLLIRDLQASQRTGHYSRQAHDNDRLRAQLLAARIRCRRWTLKQGAENVLECGIGKTYRRGRKTAREACESRATEDLHELRKQAKLFWHQLEFVASRWPHLALRRTAQVRKLTQLLGDVQDLVVYCLAIERAAGAQSPQAVEILQALAERSRRDLEARALDLAQLVYADKRGELLADLRQADTRRESQSA